MYRNDLIVQAMRRKGWSSTSFPHVGISDFTIRRVMKGGRVEVATLHIIAAALGLNIKDLFDGVPTGAQPKEGMKNLKAKTDHRSVAPSLFTDKIAA